MSERAVVALCRRCGEVDAFHSMDVEGWQEAVLGWFDAGRTVRRNRPGEVVRIACACRVQRPLQRAAS